MIFSLVFLIFFITFAVTEILKNIKHGPKAVGKALLGSPLRMLAALGLIFGYFEGMIWLAIVSAIVLFVNVMYSTREDNKEIKELKKELKQKKEEHKRSQKDK